MKIADLRVNHVKNALGFQLGSPGFSWKVIDGGDAKRQKSARIIITDKGLTVFDSGDDPCANSLDYQVDIKLMPRTHYDWSVTVTADNGETACASSWFETGKISEAWKAEWITPGFDSSIQPIMAREFTVKNEIKKARMYMCGLGVYELYMNGQKVGDEFLAPGYHSYDFHLQVQTYDVTSYLKQGVNEVQIWLGDGWFKGRFGVEGGYTNLYGDRLYAISELHITYQDKTEEMIGTDGSWKCRQSPITFSNIYDGEIYDARLEEDRNWEAVIVKAPTGCGPLTDRYSLPVVKKDRFDVAELIHTPKHELVLDFGQNITGWVEFDCDLPRGTDLCLTASEVMQDGCFYHDNLRTAKTEYTYISKGEKAHVRPHFTFYGFRYVKVECKQPVSSESFTAYHLRSDFDQIGRIETEHEKVNKLFANVLWSQKDNSLDVPTDCPQRDERLGWTGDAQVFSETACYNMYMPAFYRKYLWDMRAEQDALGGSVPNVVPRLKQGLIAGHGASPWADAGVIIPWNVFLHYGSKTLLNEFYPVMKSWVDYRRNQGEEIADRHLVKDGFHFGDWLALDHDEPGPFGKTDTLYIASAYYYRCAKIVSEAAKVLGYERDSLKYGELALAILAAIQAKYVSPTSIGETQTGSALAIAFDLNPEDQAQEGEELNKRVELNNHHLNTGFVGTPLLCPALTKTGYHSKAVDLLLNEGYPGWLYSVNLGATTIWERWNSILPDGSLNPDGMNSLNHYSYGSVAAWMYADICGIRPQEPGFKKAEIRPHPDPRLGRVRGVLDAAAGLFISEWNYGEDGKVSYTVSVPFDAAAILYLPPGRYKDINGMVQPHDGKGIELRAGTCRFTEQ